MKKLHANIYFEFTKSQQKAIVVLFAIILGLQGFFYFATSHLPQDSPISQWYYVQPVANSVSSSAVKNYPIYPFNPNFISDYKAYKFGMNPTQLNRLRDYRSKNLYVNSAHEFQQVTGVSDALLSKISPYFKFPDWVNKTRKTNAYSRKFASTTPSLIKVDINQATADELKQIKGIGDGFSSRILAARQKLGFFVSMEQLKDIWGLPPEVITQLNNHFLVGELPVIDKKNVNNCSLKELMQVPYLNYNIARSILVYRSKNELPLKLEDLTKIERFPVDKINIIALYLEF
jgi:DNA uptake protein ComE-like DNA-binding protein